MRDAEIRNLAVAEAAAREATEAKAEADREAIRVENNRVRDEAIA